ncbi:hypothetical protein [Mycolicibacterium sp.]|uniref:hypothetical protein n=1 Tax=Mycolicibacterium sp. TaxID=2320850 RepID=UPI0037CBE3FF
MPASPDILMAPEAHETYLDLYRRCAAKFANPIDSNWLADEIQRIVLEIARDPDQSWLQRQRIIHRGHEGYIVVVGMPSQYEYDAAVVWRFLDGGQQTIVLAIQLEYRR